jgi:hypothetical protein
MLMLASRDGVDLELAEMVRDHVDYVRSQSRVLGHMTRTINHHYERWQEAEVRLAARRTMESILTEMVQREDSA